MALQRVLGSMLPIEEMHVRKCVTYQGTPNRAGEMSPSATARRHGCNPCTVTNWVAVQLRSFPLFLVRVTHRSD